MPTFPLPDWIATYSFTSSPRSFGAKRTGRLHAGCDLYAALGSPVQAIAKGKVLRAGGFYWGTFAIEVDHGSYGVARYCEICVAAGIAPGVSVAQGQVIGYVAQLVNPNKAAAGNPHPMLHFELYSGKGKGSLSNDDGPYKRRSDLKDPTRALFQLWSLQ